MFAMRNLKLISVQSWTYLLMTLSPYLTVKTPLVDFLNKRYLNINFTHNETGRT